MKSALLAIITLLSFNSLFGCICWNDNDLNQNIKAYDQVFLAKAEYINDTLIDSENRINTLRVLNYFKKPKQSYTSDLFINICTSGASCGSCFTYDSTYLVFMDGNGFIGQAYSCSNSGLVSDSLIQSYLDELKLNNKGSKPDYNIFDFIKGLESSQKLVEIKEIEVAQYKELCINKTMQLYMITIISLIIIIFLITVLIRRKVTYSKVNKR